MSKDLIPGPGALVTNKAGMEQKAHYIKSTIKSMKGFPFHD